MNNFCIRSVLEGRGWGRGEGELVQGPREGVICHVPAVSVSLTNEPGRPFSDSFSHFLGVGVWGVRHREAGSGHTPLAVKSLIKIKTVDLIIQIFLSYLSPPPSSSLFYPGLHFAKRRRYS